MHKKRVERLKRKEKRNKLLNSWTLQTQGRRLYEPNNICPAISATIAVIYRKQMVGKYALKIKDICTIPHVLHHSVGARLEEAMLIQLWAKKGRSEFITPRFAVSRHCHGVDRSGVIEGCWLKELILIKYQSYILCCTFGLLQVSSQNYNANSYRARWLLICILPVDDKGSVYSSDLHLHVVRCM